MRIGVDARCLSMPITGIGQYTLQTLQHMPPSIHEWILYSHNKVLHKPTGQFKYTIRCANINSKLTATAWSQTVLPYWLARDRVDLFWSPRHHLPLITSNKMVKIVTIQDLVWRNFPKTMPILNRLLDSLLMPASVRVADKIITLSQATAKDLVSCLLPDYEKVAVVPAAAIREETIPLSLKEWSKLGIDRDFILFVGTKEPRKNLNRLLQAYSMLPGDLRRSTQLVIAGGKGWGGCNDSDTVKKLKNDNNIISLGYVSNSTLSNLYQRAVFVALPSLNEGFGLPLLEAMNRGTPVLTSNISSMPEVVGNAGYLVTPTDVNSIRLGMEDLLTKEELRSTLATKGLVQAGKFSWVKAAKQTLAVFEESYNKKIQA